MSEKMGWEERVDSLIDGFIKEWAKPNFIGHLLDDDDNDGGRLRRGLKEVVEEETKRARLVEIKKIEEAMLVITEGGFDCVCEFGVKGYFEALKSSLEESPEGEGK